MAVSRRFVKNSTPPPQKVTRRISLFLVFSYQQIGGNETFELCGVGVGGLVVCWIGNVIAVSFPMNHQQTHWNELEIGQKWMDWFRFSLVVVAVAFIVHGDRAHLIPTNA